LIAQGLSAPPIVVNFLFGSLQPAAFGPLVAAFFLTYWNERINGVKTLLKRAVDLRFGKVWLIPTILLLPLITGGALLIAILSREAIPDLFWTSNPLVLVVIFVYMLFLGGPVEEEFGWRRYALDRLQAKWNALISSVILGFMWRIWHLPLFFGTEEEIIYQTPIWGLVVTTILLTILMTWVYNNTGVCNCY
jgi:membrane protease YdiL (CAAX protease family)